MKKILFAFILIFSLSFLCGCTSKSEAKISENFIMLSISQNKDGSVSQSIVFSVNSAFLQKKSKNLQEILIFKQNLLKNLQTLRSEFLFSLALKYMENPKEEFKINKGVLLSEVGYINDKDCLGFEILFTSSLSWNYYHSSENDQNYNKNKKQNLFLNKQESLIQFPFSVNINDNGDKIGDKYKNYYISSAKNLSIENLIAEVYNPQFIYDYSTFYSKLHSNADLNFKGNDFKFHHVWLEEDLEKCDNVSIYIVLINKGWWIFFALAMCLGAMSIALAYIKIKNKNVKLDKAN